MAQRTFCQRFDEVTCRDPNRPAIEFNGSLVCSYRELAQRSRYIAAEILCRNPARQQVIAINLQKSISYVASLIGIWRAGCIAMPMLPDLPVARKRFMMQRAEATAIITDTSLSFDPDVVDPGVHVIEDVDAGGDVEFDELPTPLRRNELAYIVFTSGSTGQPKGVVVSHAGLMPMLDAQIKAFELDARSRSLFYLSPAFDASFSDIGTSLIAGGTLVIESDLVELSVAELFQRIDVRRITYADLPPVVMSHAAKQEIPAPSGLRTVVVGGELCPADAIRWWAPQVRLVNVYGPTEATVCTSLNVWNGSSLDRSLIGRPIESVTYRIEPLDPRDPTDGELWIAGSCLARGYLDDPTLEATKFVHQGLRWYRTGDRVRWTEDGQYHFLGRLDRQFKFHGRLVEPAEIERLLMELPDVVVAAVVPIHCADVSGATHRPVCAIGCVLQLSDASQSDDSWVRKWLAERIPAWMIPSQIVTVPEIARTTSGKVDYQKVAGVFQQQLRHDPTPLVSPHAEKLRQIWSNALRTHAIGWDDDFYLLGGDSLSALHLLANANVESIPLTLQVLESKRTLRGCLEELETLSNGMTTSDLDDKAGKIEWRHEIAPMEHRPPPNRRHYLITGATGFLGTWLSDQLISDSTATVECLVRARNPAHGLDRIECARSRFLGKSKRDHRLTQIRVICGDTRDSNWGLNTEVWDRLAENVTDVVHLAAEVHLLKSFDSLRKANVDAMIPAIELCHRRRLKSLHYASTLSVFVATDRADPRFYEDDHLESSAKVYGGYGQTKWMAERLLWKHPLSCPLSVFRLGLLTGDSRRGGHGTLNQLAMFTRGLATLGVYPFGCDSLRFDVTPVDYASNAIFHLIHRRARGVFHVCAPQAVFLEDWIDAMRAAGVLMTRVSKTEFESAVRQRLCARRSDDAAAACLSLCRRLETNEHASLHRELDLFLSTDASFDSAGTVQALSGTNAMHWKMDRDVLIRMVKSIVSSRQALWRV